MEKKVVLELYERGSVKTREVFSGEMGKAQTYPTLMEVVVKASLDALKETIDLPKKKQSVYAASKPWSWGARDWFLNEI